MSRSDKPELRLDWLTVALFGVFVLFGWFNIYAASGASGAGFWTDLMDIGQPQGKQFIFILISAVLCFVTLTLDIKLVEWAAYGVYGVSIFLCILVLFVGKEINGAKAWFSFGGFGVQPSEFAKVGTVLAVARYMSRHGFSLGSLKDKLYLLGIIGLPMALIILQKDTGTALVFSAFIFMLLREGLSLAFFGLLIALLAVALLSMAGVGTLYLAGFMIFLLLLYYFRRPIGKFVSNLGFYLDFRGRSSLVPAVVVAGLIVWSLSINLVIGQLKPHQQDRIKALFNPDFDPMRTNWNTHQSKIAIGSGGLWGKGFMNGTQTKYDYVPQQHTDFIFCTVGEEFGWLGSSLVIVLFFVLLWQLTYLSENTKTRFGRVLGYSVTAIFFFHILVNIAMTIGLAPVIGIPLPFFSYGGSSLMTFSVLIFLVLNSHANRVHILSQERA
ncbi:MAG: rod shape-determining protein RodA [Bacteroidetes bacterium]|nr:rod shape-determining protein RodA [Bacteroidota bacterium]